MVVEVKIRMAKKVSRKDPKGLVAANYAPYFRSRKDTKMQRDLENVSIYRSMARTMALGCLTFILYRSQTFLFWKRQSN